MWWMTAMVDGRRVCKSTGTTNKRVAQKRQEAWRTGTLACQSAFVDKAVFSIWGDRRERILSLVDHSPSRAIGGSKSMYARLIPGKCHAAKNPFELKFGKLHQYTNIPPFRLSIRSDRTPLSGAQVAAVANSLFRRGLRVQVTYVEFTFDVLGYSFAYFRQRLFTRARSTTELGREGHKTFYAEKPRSPWQLRVYQKTESIVRVEYALRRAFLRAQRIDLVRLRNLNVWAPASFQEFNEDRLAAALEKIPSGWAKSRLQESPHRLPFRMLSTALRWRCGIDPAPLLRRSKAQHLLRSMQDSVLW